MSDELFFGGLTWGGLAVGRNLTRLTQGPEAVRNLTSFDTFDTMGLEAGPNLTS